MEDKLLKLLYEDQLISDEQYQQVQEECGKLSLRSETVLEQLGILSEDAVIEFLGKKFRMPVLNWEEYTVDEELLRLVPESLAIKYTVFPYVLERGKRGGKITLAVADPSDVSAIDDISFRTGCIVRAAVSSAKAIHQAIQQYYEGQHVESTARALSRQPLQTAQKFSATHIEAFDSVLTRLFRSGELAEEVTADPLTTLDQEHPSSKLLFDLLDTAVDKGISEIHLMPCEQEYRVRFRAQGVLQEYSSIPKHVGRGIALRLRRLLQYAETTPLANKHETTSSSGSFFTSQIQGEVLTILVSFYSSLYGEKILLKPNLLSSLMPLEQIGISDAHLKTLHRMLAKSEGLLLLMSPPGEGKTTTLYSILHHYRDASMQIITVERPVRLMMPGVAQITGNLPIAYRDWYTFLLSTNPDLLAFGSVDNALMSRLAFECASSTQVLASCSACELIDGLSMFTSLLGSSCGLPVSQVAPVLSETITGVVLQRLVKTICPHCKEEVPVHEQNTKFLEWLTVEEDDKNFPVYRGNGCQKCMDTGYAGQTGLFEVVRFDKQIRQFLLQRPPISSEQWRQLLAEMSIDTLKQQGLHKVREGITSPEEIQRVLFAD